MSAYGNDRFALGVPVGAAIDVVVEANGHIHTTGVVLPVPAES